MLKKFKYNDIQQCHFLNNKNNIKLYYTYKKNKYFINLKKIQALKVLYWK